MKEFTPHQWKQLDTLLSRALELDPVNRQEFLDQQTQTHPYLSTELKRLVKLHDEAADVLGNSITDFFSPIMPTSNDSNQTNTDYSDFDVGTEIGSYRISDTIGRGGMGDIYLAHRTDGLHDQPVALKVLRAGLDSRDILRRFRQERRVLASLDHPNIARLYDGGITANGRPWFVMEYVDGIPIDQFCEQHNHTILERLHLFISVCKAVGYAHQKLVVHRDLKPSNILVKADSTIKLLDFGIAKLLSDDFDIQNVEASITRREDRFVSPGYASPEQLSGDSISTASDLFSLGAVLYKLLTSQLPFKRQTEFSRFVDYNREPELPSNAVKSSYINQGFSNAAAEKKLKGDLDTIIMKALRIEPDRRYRTSDQLVDDIERHLNHLPIAAQSDSMSYRVNKFVKRHRIGVILSAISLIFGFGFIFMLLYQNSQIKAERALAITERDKAIEVSAFLEELFAASDPAFGTTRADTLRVKNYLAHGAYYVRRDLNTQPAVQAQMLNVLGSVNMELGLLEESESLLEESMDIRASLFTGDHPDIAESMNSIGELLHKSDKLEEAKQYLTDALDMRLRLFEYTHADVGKSYTTLANLVNTKGDFKRAEELYRLAIEVFTELYGQYHKKTGAATANLATVLQRQGKIAHAELMHMQAIEIYDQVLDSNHPLIATSSNNLAQLFSEQGKFGDAELHAKRALAIRKELYGDEHPETLSSLNNVASILADIGKIDEAKKMYLRSLELRKKVHGEKSMAVAVALNNLAALHKRTFEYDEAGLFYKEAITIAEEVLGSEHPSVGIIGANLGASLRLIGKREEAETYYLSSLSILQTTLPADHPSLARTKIGYAYCLADRNEFEEAEKLMKEGYETLKEKGSNLTVAYEAFVHLYELSGNTNQHQRYESLLTMDTSDQISE